MAGKPLTVLTPTAGQVGTFVAAEPAHARHLRVTFSAPGHGTTTQIVELKAGATGLG